MSHETLLTQCTPPQCVIENTQGPLCTSQSRASGVGSRLACCFEAEEFVVFPSGSLDSDLGILSPVSLAVECWLAEAHAALSSFFCVFWGFNRSLHFVASTFTLYPLTNPQVPSLSSSFPTPPLSSFLNLFF